VARSIIGCGIVGISAANIVIIIKLLINGATNETYETVINIFVP
jgi:hypothetical protein